jgi:hypothetical protein
MDAPDACADPLPSQTWHLHWQAAEGQCFLPTAGMAERIRERLIAAHQRRGRVLIEYKILPTEIHLVSRISAGDSPGQVAGGIGNFVSRWVREVRRTRSPVMSGPFQSCVLASDEAVRHEIRMLAWRPVQLGLCRGPTFHAHGALRIALGLRRADGFDARPMLRCFGQQTSEARAALSRWVSRRPSALQWRSWELARGLLLAPSFGGPDPTGFRQVKTPEAAALLAMAGPGGVDAALALLAEWVTFKLGAAQSLDLQEGQDARSVRGRALVTRLATRHRLCSAAFVARYFGRAKATLCEQVAASRGRVEDTGLVSTPVERIIEAWAASRPVSAPGLGARPGDTEHS